MKNIWQLLKLIPEYRWRLMSVMALSSSLGLLGVAVPYLFKLIVDQIALATSHHLPQQQVVHNVIVILSLLAALRGTVIILSYLQERVSDLLFMDVMMALRSRIFGQLSSLSLDYFEKTRTGEIMQRYSGALEFGRWLFNAAELSLNNIFQVVFTVLLLIKLNLWIGLLMLAIVPINIGNALRKVEQTKPIRRKWLEKAEKFSGILNEMVSHIATVRSFANESALGDRFNQLQIAWRRDRLVQHRIEWNANLWRMLLSSIAILVSVAIITFAAAAGHNTPGDVFLVLSLTGSLINSLFPITRLITDTGDIETTSERIVGLLENKPSVVDQSDAQALDTLSSIEFKNVSFAYPGKKRQILDRISFKLEHGQSLALVGPSGTGKTTITKLLLRFYEPTSGEILVNGRDIREFTQDSLRNHIGVVMQDVALFNDSIEDNIAFASPAAGKEAVRQAAVAAHADVFIEKLAEGYKTLVGERGIKLSGGEKQRIAIARAILKSPQLIILDEATSALDSESEQYVQDGLGKLMTGRTAVIIAHRLSTVMKADQILVLKNGKVIERGRHSQLIAQSGLYAKLFALQTKHIKN